MMGTTEDFTKLREKRDALERKRARREADMDLATKKRDEALSEMQEKFGCGSVADAERLLAEMQESIARDIAAVEESLEALEA